MLRRHQWHYRTLLVVALLGLACWTVWPAFTKSVQFFRTGSKLISGQVASKTNSSHSTRGSKMILPKTDRAAEAQAAESYGKLPLSFEPNLGQADPSVKFLSRGSGYNLFLTPSELLLALKSQHSKAENFRVQFVGSSTTAQLLAQDEVESKSNYLLGDNPS